MPSSEKFQTGPERRGCESGAIVPVGRDDTNEWAPSWPRERGKKPPKRVQHREKANRHNGKKGGGLYCHKV